MIKEAFETIASLVRRAETPQKLDYPGHDAAHFVINGEVKEIPLPVPDRKHVVGSLRDLIELANRFHAAGKSPAVWYDPEGVVLVIDDGDQDPRAQTATLPLLYSDLFRAVHCLRQTGPRSQREFVRQLRIGLAGALDPGVLLNPVRKLDWLSETKVSSDVQRSRESMGRSVTAQVATEREIPEEVTLSVPVFQGPGLSTRRYPVPCLVDVDAMEHTIRLVPAPDAIEDATQMALETIAGQLLDGLESGIPAYHGRP